jgi:hypothetical protein
LPDPARVNEFGPKQYEQLAGQDIEGSSMKWRIQVDYSRIDLYNIYNRLTKAVTCRRELIRRIYVLIYGSRMHSRPQGIPKEETMSKKPVIAVLLLLAIILSACNMPTSPDSTSAPVSSTLAAQTLQAMMTQVAGKATTPPLVTATPRANSPTNAPAQATSTKAPESTKPPVATKPPDPTATSTPKPVPCDAAAFVSDITVPDGSIFTANSQFVKTWKLKNTGTCTWSTSYAIVFTEGNAMSTPAATNLPSSVAPNDTIEISLTMTAPGAVGTYRGNWKLRNAAGVVFGTGQSGNGSFYAEIKVAAPTSINGSYSFVDNYCAAEWSNASAAIPCTAKDGAASGFVLRTDKPVLETGATENESGLITVPQQINDGVIRGKYPPVTIKAGDTFRTIVGCEYEASNCKVRFQLDYQVDNGAVQTLSSWDESYDGAFTKVSVDLTSLAGKNVRFILSVFANGAAKGDRALWLLPRITRVTPTATPNP